MNKREQILHFLLVYNHETGERELFQFGDDSKRAVKAYEDMEQRYRKQPRVDIVLVGSDSLASVKVTHSTYFADDSASDVEDFLRSLAERSDEITA